MLERTGQESVLWAVRVYAGLRPRCPAMTPQPSFGPSAGSTSRWKLQPHHRAGDERLVGVGRGAGQKRRHQAAARRCPGASGRPSTDPAAPAKERRGSLSGMTSSWKPHLGQPPRRTPCPPRALAASCDPRQTPRTGTSPPVAVTDELLLRPEARASPRWRTGGPAQDHHRPPRPTRVCRRPGPITVASRPSPLKQLPSGSRDPRWDCSV